MKQTQAIFLTFNASSVSDNVLINVPFPIKTIHVKSMNYNAATNGKTGNVMVISPFGLNAPFGIVNQDTSYSSASVQDIKIQVKNAITIQGYYTFRIVGMSGVAAITSNAGAGIDFIGMIIEFSSEDEAD
jgi:hypothetical protein